MSEELLAAADPASTPAEATGIFAWYKELSRTERRAFWACFGGWGLDGVDIKLYGWVMPTLLAAWGMSRAEAGSIATVALLSSALGGWIGGVLADRLGRVRVLQVTILWFSLFTLLCAVTNSYAQLLVMRSLHGLGFGAEWGVGAALIGEIVRDKYRGTASGTVHSAWAVGGGAAAILYAAMFSAFPADIAWRALFALGALPAAFVLYIRRFVTDSPIFLADRRARAKAGASGGFSAIFAPELLRSTVLGAMVSMGCIGGASAVHTWLPTYLNTVRHLSVMGTSAFVVTFEVAHFCGYIGGAHLADIIGRRLNFILMAAATSITVAAYMLLPVGDTVIFLLGIPLGFFGSGVYSGIGAILNEIFPTRVRGSGIGFCFNFGRAMGAVFPTLVGILAAAMPLSAAIGALSVSAYGLVVVAALLLPETKGHALPA